MADRLVVPLADSITLEWCRESPARSYARIRLFGSLGFIVLSLAVGRALTLRGDRPADAAISLCCRAGWDPMTAQSLTGCCGRTGRCLNTGHTVPPSC